MKYRIGIDWGIKTASIVIIDEKDKICLIMEFYKELEKFINAGSLNEFELAEQYSYLLKQEIVSLITLKNATEIEIKVEVGFFGAFSVRHARWYQHFKTLFDLSIEENWNINVHEIWPVEWKAQFDLPVRVKKISGTRNKSLKKMTIDKFNKEVLIPQRDIYQETIQYQKPLKIQQSHIADAYFVAIYDVIRKRMEHMLRDIDKLFQKELKQKRTIPLKFKIKGDKN